MKGVIIYCSKGVPPRRVLQFVNLLSFILISGGKSFTGRGVHSREGSDVPTATNLLLNKLASSSYE